MDIVSRLEYFLKKSGLSNSEFADACDIPRPTLTQLLKRRNKKVSDEIISKIHTTYPNLSVMWLMFGDEPMFVGQNPIATKQGSSDAEMAKNDTANNLFSQPMYDMHDRDKEINFLGENEPVATTKKNDDRLQNDLPGDFLSALKRGSANAVMGGVNTPPNARKVVSIYVFYSDKSFDVFTPSK